MHTHTGLRFLRETLTHLCFSSSWPHRHMSPVSYGPFWHPDPNTHVHGAQGTPHPGKYWEIEFNKEKGQTEVSKCRAWPALVYTCAAAFIPLSLCFPALAPPQATLIGPFLNHAVISLTYTIPTKTSYNGFYTILKCSSPASHR